MAPAPVALLDVNVLVGMFDDNHVHHTIAHDWFASHGSAGWATCPLTENGLIRTISRSLDDGQGRRVMSVIRLLYRFRHSGGHQFWADDVSLTDEAWFTQRRHLGHKQLTDAYLLALAVKHNGMLVTFDRGIPLTAVGNARSGHLAVLAPDD